MYVLGGILCSWCREIGSRGFAGNPPRKDVKGFMVGDKKLQRDGGGKVGSISRVSKVSMVESKAIGEEKKKSRIKQSKTE